MYGLLVPLVLLKQIRCIIDQTIQQLTLTTDKVDDSSVVGHLLLLTDIRFRGPC